MDEHDKGQVAASAAEIYDEFFVPALFADWPEHIIDAVALAAGHSVLDVACGTGVLATSALRIVGDAGQVTGVDINDGMLAVARTKSADINWRQGEAEALPFETDSFDRVVSQFGLMFFADRVQSIAEMLRVAKPGGNVAVAVWGPLADTPGYAAVADMLNDLFGAEVANSIRAPYSLGDTSELRALFAEAGADNVDIRTVEGKARFASIEDWMYTDIKGWTLADVIDDAGYKRLQEAGTNRLAPFVLPDGSVEFTAPAHIISLTNR